MCITKQKQVQVQGQKSNSTFNIRYSSFNIQNTRNTPNPDTYRDLKGTILSKKFYFNSFKSNK